MPIWSNIKYFKKNDFACKCSRHNKDNPALPEYAELNYFYLCRYFLDPLRKDCNSAVIVNSAFRCIPHNKEEGGSKYSHHTILDTLKPETDKRPDAIDIYCTGLGHKEFDLKIKEHTDIEYCGYHIYTRFVGEQLLYFIHIDFRGFKSRW